MPIYVKLQMVAVFAGLITGCVLPPRMPQPREQLVDVLEEELTKSTGWVQVHAADALLDHHETNRVAEIFAPLAATPPAPFRIGVWRVMARASSSKAERLTFVERIRSVMQDPTAPDRLQAAESIAKLGAVNVSDRAGLQTWLGTANDATNAFVRWLLVMSATPAERPADESALTALLDSSDDIARLRAVVALGKVKDISVASANRLHEQIVREPKDTIGRVYVVAANLRHTDRNSLDYKNLKRELLGYLKNGKPNEQLEAGIVLGERGDANDRASLERALASTEPDARIGAASGLIYLQK